MDCAEIREAFLEGDLRCEPHLAAHLEHCPACRELCADAPRPLGFDLASTAAAAPGGVATIQAIESLIARDYGARAYLRSRATPVRWLLLLVVPAVLIAREAITSHGRWLELSPSRSLIGVLLAGLLLASARAALKPFTARSGAARARTALATAACCLPWALCLSPDNHGASGDAVSGFSLRSLACFGYGGALAAPSFALLWFFDRGPHLTRSARIFGAALVGTVANLILLLHCPVVSRAHVVAGHLSIGLVWLLAVSVSFASKPNSFRSR